MFSFEMNKVNPFPALTAPRALIFLSKLSIIDEVANLGKTCLVKGRAMLISASLLNLPMYYQEIRLIELF